MNYYGGKELAESFRTVRKNTLAIAEDIPEDKYDFRPMPETRSVAELLAHIALSNGFQKAIHAEQRLIDPGGIRFSRVDEEACPRRKKRRARRPS